MASPPAARVGDPITHTNAMTGLLVGLGVGLLVGAAIVATGGAAAPLAIAAGAATGGSLGGMAGKFLGGLSTQVKGQITKGSPNVRINSLFAAFCSSEATCSNHSSPVLVAQGSSTVGINGLPAARTGDKGSCAFAVGDGSPNVTIGGAPAACGDVGSEVPWWADAGLLVLGLAGGGVSLAIKGLSGAAIAARLGGSVLVGTAGGMTGNYVGGEIFGEGSTGQSVMAFGGSIVGGYYGFKGGAKLDAVPRYNPFNYRLSANPNKLGSNFGNLDAEYVGPSQGVAPGRQGVTQEQYDYLRSRTPSTAMRRAVNKGVTLPMEDPALPGQQITKPLQADHIVSMERITKMDGFSKLTPENQLRVLNEPDNFVGLSEAANKSKQAKTYAEWTEHKGLGVKVDPAFRERMIQVERNVEPKLQTRIQELLDQQGQGGP